MKFIIDANIPKALCMKLLREGYDCVDIRDTMPADTPDALVYSEALRQNRTIISKDKHFGNILLYPPRDHFGIIVLRTHKMNTEQQAQTLLRFLNTSGENDFKEKLFIVENDKYRKRSG